MQNLIDYLFKPWPWYISGILIGLMVPLGLLLGNKPFGISSSMRHICAACIPSKIKFFNYDWKKELWNLFFVGGILIGAVLASKYLSINEPIIDNNANQLSEIGNNLAPISIFSFKTLFTLQGFIFIVGGGFLVGFGTRYANGCTSGHSIMGLSNLQLSSLIATVCFMIGGLLFSWFVIPYLLQL